MNDRKTWWFAILLAGCGLLTLTSCQGGGSDTAGKSPNVLVIVLDTTRAEYFSCYGHDVPTTPHLDQLAAEGIRFDQTIATDNWTLPSHASLFTGLYPSECQATSITNHLPEHNLTLAERLKQAGYWTGAVVHNAWISQERGFSQGFDDFVEMWRQENRPAGDSRGLTGEQKGVDRAIQWIDDWHSGRSSGSGQPFLLFANFNIAHLPYTPPASVRERFLPSAVADEGRVRRMMQVVGMWPHLAGRLVLDDQDFEVLARLYEAELSRADDYVGQLMAALEERSLTDDTLVIVTSDHGENLGDHGMIDHLLSMYDSTLRIPMIMRLPGRIPPGTVSPDLASLVDVAPTVTHLCGLSSDDQATGPFAIPELSLLHPDRYQRKFVFAENDRPVNGIELLRQNAPEFDTSRIDCRMFAIRSDRHKLIWHEDLKVELYDLQTDPGELVNLADSQPELRDEMMGHLKNWLDNLVPGGAVSAISSTDSEALESLRSLGYVK